MDMDHGKSLYAGWIAVNIRYGHSYDFCITPIEILFTNLKAFLCDKAYRNWHTGVSAVINSPCQKINSASPVHEFQADRTLWEPRATGRGALMGIANKWKMPHWMLLFPPLPLRSYFKALLEFIHYWCAQIVSMWDLFIKVISSWTEIQEEHVWLFTN